MPKILGYHRSDGGVSIVTPTPALIMEYHLGRPLGSLSWQGPPIASPDGVMPLAEAEDRALQFVQEKDIPAGAMDITNLDSKDLPPDRTRRHAWRLRGGRCIVDPLVPDPPPPRDRMKELEDRLAALERRP